jgi:hypothetical protein
MDVCLTWDLSGRSLAIPLTLLEHVLPRNALLLLII